MMIEVAFSIAAVVVTVILGFVLVPIVRKAMNEDAADPKRPSRRDGSGT